jgi:hypothetical protein
LLLFTPEEAVNLLGAWNRKTAGCAAVLPRRLPDMSLQGDLSTLDLSGLLQNLEAAKKTGLLSVQDGQGETKLYFHQGKLALVSYPERPELMDILVVSGAISARQLESARKRRRRSKRSLGETLVAMGAIEQERLATIAAARLTDEACELIAAGAGAFVFTEGGIPRGVFDPEERALGITLPAGPLLLEAARRQDHWKLIRERVPSDSIHYALHRSPRAPQDPHQAELLARMTPLLDGSRSVLEVVAAFPHRRFEAYQLLADLAEAQAIKVAAPSEMNRRIQELARHDRARALVLLERSLAASPRNLDLLSTKALLAEELGELEEASEALKMAVHLQLEAGSAGEARAGLERLKELGPEDPFVWERSFELALEEGRTEDALEDGATLVELYRGPGLFRKAAAVLERMVEVSGGAWEHVKALAHARADGGEREAAVRGLEQYGQQQLAQELYPFARKVYEEILAIEPDSKDARETIEEIRSGELARRRARWRKLRRRALLTVVGALALTWLGYEMQARQAYSLATREITRGGLIEAGRYSEAIERYAQVRARYPWATVSLYEIGTQISELRARLDAAGARRGS